MKEGSRDRNTWLAEYWESLKCDQLVRSERQTMGDCFKAAGVKFVQEAYVPFVFDAVTVVAHALNAYVKVRRYL
jgi:hypothetical protein